MMARLSKDMAGYAVASACALMVDVGVLAFLVSYLSWSYLSAATLSFALGLLVAYEMSTRFVFNQRRFQDRRVEFLSFAAIGGVGLVVNAAAMFLAVKYGGLNYLAAKCVAAAFTFLCNFFSRRQLLFVRPVSA